MTQKKQRARIVIKELTRLYPSPQMALVYHTPWELLFAVMLSAQTTDIRVNQVTAILFKKYTTLASYASTMLTDFEKDIRTIGLYRSKAKHILATANILLERYNGELPKTMDAMTALPGVGRKTANVVLGAHYNCAFGIAVDTHVRRLAKKFGLTTSTDPKKIEKDLMEIIPQKEWFHFTIRMIDYGREYSRARAIKRSDDPISRALAAQQLLP